MEKKVFNDDFWALKGEVQLASHPKILAVMGPRARNRFAASIARAMKRCIDENPNQKPDYRAVCGMVAKDQEIKGFIPAFILVAVFGWAIQKLLDYIWDNWSAQPHGDPD